MKLKNPSVLITGGTKRIGLELAKQCLAMGFDIILQYRSNRSDADKWLLKNKILRQRVAFIRHDLAVEPAAVVDAAAGLSRSLIGLVNNASNFTKGNLNDTGHFFAMLASNTFAPLALCRRFTTVAKSGWIINITDAHIRPINRNWQNYRVSKIMLEELTRQLAFLHAPAFRVNALAPGAILPAKTLMGQENFALLKHTIPLKRTGDMASVINAFELLVRNEYITGQTLFVDGGWHLVG